MSPLDVVSTGVIVVSKVRTENIFGTFAESRFNGFLKSFLFFDWLCHTEFPIKLRKCSRWVQSEPVLWKADGFSLRLTNGYEMEGLRRVNIYAEVTWCSPRTHFELCISTSEISFICSGDWNWGMIRLSWMTRRDTKTTNLEEPVRVIEVRLSESWRRQDIEMEECVGWGRNWFNWIWHESEIEDRRTTDVTLIWLTKIESTTQETPER